MFKALSKLMNSLQTFVEFSFERGKLDMTQQEYEDYRSKYFMLYHQHQRNVDKVSVHV